MIWIRKIHTLQLTHQGGVHYLLLPSLQLVFVTLTMWDLRELGMVCFGVVMLWVYLLVQSWNLTLGPHRHQRTYVLAAESNTWLPTLCSYSKEYEVYSWIKTFLKNWHSSWIVGIWTGRVCHLWYLHYCTINILIRTTTLALSRE